VRRLGAQRGQTTAEYLGLLVVVALIVAAIGASGLKDTVVAGMQAAVCQMFPDENCAVSDEELARGDEDAAPRAAVPDPDLPAIQRTATTRDLGLGQPAGLDATPATAPTRPASLEPPPIPLPAGGTLIPPSDDPAVRELSGAENLEAAFDALLEGDVLGATEGLFFGAPVGPGKAGKFGERAAQLTRQAAQRTRQAAERLNSTLRDAWQRLLREQRGEARLPGGGRSRPAPRNPTREGDRAQGPIGLPTFTQTTIEEAVTSSARLGKGRQLQEGARAMAKKQGQGAPPFAGLPRTQAQAEAIIRDVLRRPSVGDRGDRVIDIYNAAGQGVRLRRDTRAFQGFLDRGRRGPSR
jgi:hypothetical protein